MSIIWLEGVLPYAKDQSNKSISKMENIHLSIFKIVRKTLGILTRWEIKRVKTILALVSITVLASLCLGILINGLVVTEEDFSENQTSMVEAMEASGSMAAASELSDAPSTED